jgi:hypothetical protein
VTVTIYSIRRDLGCCFMSVLLSAIGMLRSELPSLTGLMSLSFGL